MAKLTFVLVGPRAGTDFVIPSVGVEFKNGIYEHEVTGMADASAQPFINILGSCYNAHPMGSDELVAAEELWEKNQKKPVEIINLDDFTNKQLIDYAMDNFEAEIKGTKAELIAQIGHLRVLQNPVV